MKIKLNSNFGDNKITNLDNINIDKIWILLKSSFIFLIILNSFKTKFLFTHFTKSLSMSELKQIVLLPSNNIKLYKSDDNKRYKITAVKYAEEDLNSMDDDCSQVCIKTISPKIITDISCYGLYEVCFSQK